MKKQLSTPVLAAILALCLCVVGALVAALVLMPRDCTHHACDTQSYAPTCDEKGYTHYTCKRCGYEFDADFLAPTGHDFTEDLTPPTCDSEGYASYTCKKCGKVDKKDYISPTGHTYMKKVTSPTCEDEGYTLYTCRDCGFEVKTEYTAPSGHTYSKTYVRPNISQTGYTVYTCTVCGSSHKADYAFYSDIFSGAAGEGRGGLAWGVDLSKWSGNVDFAKLKRLGVDYVILRVGSNTSKDPNFEEYYRAARAAGLDIGAYFFTFAESARDAEADAKRVASWLSGKKFEYPIFYDVEDYAEDNYHPSQFSEELIMQICHTFMTNMVDRGYYPGLYTNNKFLYNTFNTEKTLCLYDIWFARYGTDPDAFCEENIDEYSGIYSMWQYAGGVVGFGGGAVEGACDINYAFKNYPAIIKKHGFNGYQ